MKKVVAVLSAFLVVFGTLSGSSSTFMDYQNYNHGYCPSCNCYPCDCNRNLNSESNYPIGPTDGLPSDPPPCPAPPSQPVPPPCSAPSCQAPRAPPCDPCDPCAPMCGTECGVSVCAIAVAVAAIVAAAAIILASSSESSHNH